MYRHDSVEEPLAPSRRDSGARKRLDEMAEGARIVIGASSATPSIDDDSVALVVTSPPFLDVVDYKGDNWLRCWFCGIDASVVPVTLARQTDAWKAFVTSTLSELRRVLRPNGHVAFEVGEVRGGALRLEEIVIPAAIDGGSRTGARSGECAAVHEDGQLLGCDEQQQRHQHESRRAASETSRSDSKRPALHRPCDSIQ